MKVAIIGNCQGDNLRSCLEAMVPGSQVSFTSPGQLLPATAEDAEVVCIQTGSRHLLAEEQEFAHLASRHIVAWPTFYFPAFHPDLAYVELPKGVAQSPLGDYQSSIVFHAWSQGLNAEETQALFCEAVYNHLGFYNFWEASKQAMLKDMESTGLDLEGALEGWVAQGCFAHSANHPKLFVTSTVARAMLKQLGITPRTDRPEDFVRDALRDSIIWPVYPEVAERLGIQGDYTFKVSHHLCTPEHPIRLLDLREFIEGSLASLSSYPRADLHCSRTVAQADLYRGIRDIAASARRRRSNPYAALPDHQFWRKAVAEPAWDQVDPGAHTGFRLAAIDRIATAGSCFAQHIARTLAEADGNYYVTEPAPEGMAADRAAAGSYGQFSARYGNIYTARQLVQLVDRAYDRFAPADTVWTRQDGRLVDPFRPQIEQEGFGSPAEVEASRDRHLAAVRTLIETTDVFVFTLGAVFPGAPGVVAHDLPAHDYEFVNFTADEVRRDLREVLSRLKAANPAIRVILTVSPVPLVATYEDRHVLVSTTYSKSALRVAAGEVAAEFDAVDYFPSYEVITGSFNRGRYFGDNLRDVTPEGVAHVMRLFRKYFAPAGGNPPAAPVQAPGTNDALRSEVARMSRVICDEELLERI